MKWVLAVAAVMVVPVAVIVGLVVASPDRAPANHPRGRIVGHLACPDGTATYSVSNGVVPACQ